MAEEVIYEVEVCKAEAPPQKKPRKKKKEKKPITGKIYFGLFVFLTILSVFLFWSVKNSQGEQAIASMATTLTGAVITLCLALFFGLMAFIKFLRNRTVAGGLFLTTALSTGIFLGVSQFIGFLIPPAATMAFAYESGGAGAGGMDLMILLAQIGLFAIWFTFLMFTIKVYVSPVKRVNNYLGKIVDGEKIRRIKVGKSKQYKEIEEKLRELNKKANITNDPECLKGSEIVER